MFVVHVDSYFKTRSRWVGDCLEWIKSTLIPPRLPYGQANYKGKKLKAHRLSWILHYGEIPENMVVCHKCDNPKCVNPEHLFLGTQRDNLKDMKTKGRQNITWRKISKDQNVSTWEEAEKLALKLKVHPHTIWRNRRVACQ